MAQSILRIAVKQALVALFLAESLLEAYRVKKTAIVKKRQLPFFRILLSAIKKKSREIVVSSAKFPNFEAAAQPDLEILFQHVRA